MCPRRPRSTLFPYTTLFRSDLPHHLSIKRPFRLDDEDGLLARLPRQLAERTGGNHPAAMDDEDRKSTRLNSSHRCISYAVFCLKKKIGIRDLLTSAAGSIHP